MKPADSEIRTHVVRLEGEKFTTNLYPRLFVICVGFIFERVLNTKTRVYLNLKPKFVFLGEKGKKTKTVEFFCQMLGSKKKSNLGLANERFS